MVDSVDRRSDGARDIALQSGYNCELFKDWVACKDQSEVQPPHMLLFQFNEKAWKLVDMVREAREILPETHIFLLTPSGMIPRAVDFYDKGVYDLIPLPIESPQQVVRALDRAAELNVYVYRNEQEQKPIALSLDVGGEFTSTNSSPHIQTHEMFSCFSVWLNELYHKTSVEENAEHFARGVFTNLNNTPCAYYKFFSPRRTLIASFSVGLEPVDVRGTGIDLNETEDGFRMSDLRDPQKIKAVRDLVEEVFKAESYKCVPLEVQGRILGIFIFFPKGEDPTNNLWFTSAYSAVEKNILLFETQKRLHSSGARDETTETYNRHSFLQYVSEEIARARRTELPVSLLLIKIDQLMDISDGYGREEADLILRMIGRVFRKHSRINDVIGRVSPDELGMILPHTGEAGASIKAERLRRIIESADFKKVVKHVPKLTVCIGVSEYPTLCRDADELVQTADEALYEACDRGGNIVCVTSQPEGFEADFKVKVIEKRSAP